MASDSCEHACVINKYLQSVSKNVPPTARYNFDTRPPILITLGTGTNATEILRK